MDLLLRLCPDDEDTIYQIVDLLVDTCFTKRKLLRVAGDDKPCGGRAQMWLPEHFWWWVWARRILHPSPRS